MSKKNGKTATANKPFHDLTERSENDILRKAPLKITLMGGKKFDIPVLMADKLFEWTEKFDVLYGSSTDEVVDKVEEEKEKGSALDDGDITVALDKLFINRPKELIRLVLVDYCKFEDDQLPTIYSKTDSTELFEAIMEVVGNANPFMGFFSKGAQARLASKEVPSQS